jgi:hypothetical protein
MHREGGGKIVRTLEYIIGRINGEYLSADPVLFRRNRREQTATFPFASVAHNSEDSQQYETTQQEYGPAKTYATQPSGDSIYSKREEVKSLCKSLFPDEFGDIFLKGIEFDVTKHKENESVLDGYLQYLNAMKSFSTLIKDSEKPVREKVPLWRHPYLRDLSQEARDRLARIEQTMYRWNINPVTIFNEIQRLGKDYRITKDLRILDAALEYWRRSGETKWR